MLSLVCLTSESVQGTSLAFQGIDHVHGCDGLPLGVLSVGDCVTDDILKEYLQNTSGFFIDEPRNTFHSTSASKTADGWFGDTLDVVTKDFPVALGAPLSKTFSSFTTSRHDASFTQELSVECGFAAANAL